MGKLTERALRAIDQTIQGKRNLALMLRRSGQGRAAQRVATEANALSVLRLRIWLRAHNCTRTNIRKVHRNAYGGQDPRATARLLNDLDLGDGIGLPLVLHGPGGDFVQTYPPAEQRDRSPAPSQAMHGGIAAP